MENSNVTIYLNTPLIRGEESSETPLFINRIKGKILSETGTGFLVQVKTLTGEKGGEKTFVKKFFIPVHKIDFIEVE